MCISNAKHVRSVGERNRCPTLSFNSFALACKNFVRFWRHNNPAVALGFRQLANSTSDFESAMRNAIPFSMTTCNKRRLTTFAEEAWK